MFINNSMKKLIFICIILFLIAYSLFFPEITITAAKNGLQIWFSQILPALLPFTILSAVLIKSNFLKSFHGNARLISIILTLSCGFVFGFPIGAKLSADFYKEGFLSKKEATLLAVTTNNFSPMYVCGFVLPLLFTSMNYHKATYILLYLAPLIIASCYFLIYSKNTNSNANSSLFQFNMSVMDYSILNGFESLIKICGYIVFFSIATNILSHIITYFLTEPPYIIMLFLENMEITNGINLLSVTGTSQFLKYITMIQLLSFGGFSGIAQTGSILSSAGLSTYKYIIGKAVLSLLLTLLSVIYVFFIHHL